MKYKTLVYFEDDLTQSFGITDLEMLSKGFENTYLFSQNVVRNKEELPPHVQVVESYIDWDNYDAKNYFFRNLFLLCTIILRELWSGKLAWKHIIPAIKKICSNAFRADCIENSIGKLKINVSETVFYSFWFYDCIFQAELKRRNPHSLALIRTHAGDLFEDSATLKGTSLLRTFQLSHTDLCISISQMGTDYLRSEYPKFASKIICSRLGTEDFGMAAPLNDEAFVIVSCSHVRNVKRVHLIGEALMLLSFPVKWYHFGNPGNPGDSDPYIGYFHTTISKLKEKGTIEFHLMGNLPVQELMQFYRNYPVNMLVSTSSTEGIPVSMMEAISFGIPLIGTDVGGCREIITPQTGVLLQSDIEPAALAQEITLFKNSGMNSSEFRNGVRNFWNQNFDRNKNYQELLAVIEKA